MVAVAFRQCQAALLEGAKDRGYRVLPCNVPSLEKK